MDRVKTYFIKQVNRPASHLMFDFFVVGSLLFCIYFGFFEG